MALKKYGEVTEWLKVHAWNACVRKYREFESHPLRHFAKKPFSFNSEGLFVVLRRGRYYSQ